MTDVKGVKFKQKQRKLRQQQQKEEEEAEEILNHNQNIVGYEHNIDTSNIDMTDLSLNNLNIKGKTLFKEPNKVKKKKEKKNKNKKTPSEYTKKDLIELIIELLKSTSRKCIKVSGLAEQLRSELGTSWKKLYKKKYGTFYEFLKEYDNNLIIIDKDNDVFLPASISSS